VLSEKMARGSGWTHRRPAASEEAGGLPGVRLILGVVRAPTAHLLSIESAAAPKGGSLTVPLVEQPAEYHSTDWDGLMFQDAR